MKFDIYRLHLSKKLDFVEKTKIIDFRKTRTVLRVSENISEK